MGSRLRVVRERGGPFDHGHEVLEATVCLGEGPRDRDLGRPVGHPP